MKKFNEFINEKLEFKTSTMRGKTVVSPITASTSSMNEFIKHIKSIPETLESIKIPTSTSAFSPTREEFKRPITSSDKNKIIKIIKDMTKEFKKEGDSVYKYSINSFFTLVSVENELTNPYYIRFNTKAHDKFSKRMSRGDHGSLD